MPELLIGCGNSREKHMWIQDRKGWSDLTTLDIDPNCGADVTHDLNQLPYPFDDCQFDEIHAYEVLEHCGRQGDWRFFFDQFAEFWRILKPDGVLFATVPHWLSVWAWGDPSHTRVIPLESLIFLSQKEYTKQVGKTAMSDFRHYWKRDFDMNYAKMEDGTLYFVLQARK